MVGLEFTVVQSGVLGFLAGSSPNFHIEHILQAFHYLDQGFADVGLLEQEDVIRIVVEPFDAVSGCFEDSWVIGLDCFGKSWLYT